MNAGGMKRELRVCVIGAGVNGLCAGVQVQEMLRRRGVEGQVVLLADKFDRETTSDGAAGMFNPRVNVVKGVPRELCRQWFRDSFHFFHALAISQEASEAGVQFVSGYEFSTTPPFEDPIFGELYYNIRELSAKEVALFTFSTPPAKGVFYTTLMVESRWFLPWLMKRFKEGGGVVQQRKLGSLQEVAAAFDVAVNCSGLGSNQLLGLSDTVPIRGQLLRVRAPWVKHFMVVDNYSVYVMPGRETVVVGGTYQVGDAGEDVRQKDTERMWKAACQHMPSLQRAEWQWQWVGLRPHREPVRLEKEQLHFGEVSLQVVHNYGHGGNGIALCWGTGKHVCSLVEQLLVEKY